MTTDIAKLPMQDRFQHLFSVISSQRFLNKQGLGNEVPLSKAMKLRSYLQRCLVDRRN